MDLRGKTAIITGASSGIGDAAARLFAEAGARVVVGARRQDRLDDLVRDIESAGGSAVAVAGDVRDESFAADLVDTARRHFDRLDIAFNNAGTLGTPGPVIDLSAEDWSQTIAVNLTGAFYGAKHQLAAMTEGGSLIFCSSFVGHTIGFPGMAAYGASKAGLIGMVQCLAAEVGPAGIRVNALLPGGTRTPMVGDFAADPSAADMIAGFHALKRMAEPGEIARAALFLASDAASFITGSAMLVDGGNSITKA